MNEVFGTLTDFMGVVIIVTFLGSVLSVGYVTYVYRRSTRQSIIFRMLVRADVMKVAGATWLGCLAVFRLFNDGQPLPPWTVLVSAFAVEILLIPPILHALTLRKLRRNYGDSTPPPWHPED